MTPARQIIEDIKVMLCQHYEHEMMLLGPKTEIIWKENYPVIEQMIVFEVGNKKFEIAVRDKSGE